MDPPGCKSGLIWPECVPRPADRYIALDYEERILDVARAWRTFRDDFQREFAAVGRSGEVYFAATGDESDSAVRRFVRTVDQCLTWLEKSTDKAMSGLKKREAVLRGLLQLTDIKKHVSIIGVLEFVQNFLDVPEDPYPVQRQCIADCLKELEANKVRLFKNISKAGALLEDMIKSQDADLVQGKLFDNAVREVNVDLKNSQTVFARADKELDGLVRTMRFVKWRSRIVRLVCFCVFLGWLCYRHNVGSLTVLEVCISSGVAFFTSVAWLPKRAYGFLATLDGLRAKQRTVSDGLDDLRRTVRSHVDHRDKIIEKDEEN